MLSMVTGVPFFSFICPVVTTTSPSLMPFRMATWSPRVSPVVTKVCSRGLRRRPCRARSTNTVLPYGIEGDRRLRQRQVALRRADVDLDRGVHAGQQLAIGDWQRRLAPARCAWLGSICGLIAVIFPVKCLARIGVDLGGDRLADRDLGQRLLRQEEVDIDRIDRLQRHDSCAGFRYCPGLTVRMPRWPANGARSDFLSIIACCCSTWARAFFRLNVWESTIA